MNPDNDQCQFVFELEDSEKSEHDVDGWECPHEVAEASKDRCLFHLRENNREKVDEKQVADAFLECTSSAGRRSKEFVGARIDLLNIDFQQIDSPDNYPIDLRHAVIDTFQANHTRFEQPLLLSDAYVYVADFSHAEFSGPWDISSSWFGALTCIQSLFNQRVRVRDSTCIFALFDDATFQRGATFQQTRFYSGASFQSCKFADTVNFESSSFESLYTNVDTTESEDAYRNVRNLSIFPLMLGRRSVDPKNQTDQSTIKEQTTQEQRIYFSERDFVREDFTHINDKTFNGGDFRSAQFQSRASFDGAEFDHADFGNAVFDQRVSFIETQIFATINFHSVDFHTVDMKFDPINVLSVLGDSASRTFSDLENKARVYLDSSTVRRGQFRQPSLGDVYFDISNGCIGDVDTVSDENSFKYLIVNRTDFDGFDFTAYRDDLEEIDWEIDRSSVTTVVDAIDQDQTVREITYLKAKQGASQIGDSKAKSEFFQREMNFRCSQYAISPNSLDSELDFFLESLRSAPHILSNQIYRVTCGYGEKPHRVVLSYVVLLIWLSMFLMIPNLAEGKPALFVEGVQTVGYMLTFGTSGSVPSSISPLVAIFQTFVVPSFVALLVFTLSRSIQR
ncbi:pentapeptide repeat-containing protein [Natrinema sp. CGMCC1.2065]|uniref:pentapeptide repeat-containing protein n=1 Tax=Natrinema sp. CGMCC1.2065 TaxID=3445767 RepID=UPI003F4A518D